MRNQVVNQEQLNLARKWRSKKFDQIIGQDLSVKILKNSLYLDRLFPVYLFAGQRGCGKTTTARVFAAAINCDVSPRVNIVAVVLFQATSQDKSASSSCCN